MNCASCNASLSPGMPFCTECGAKAPEVATVDGLLESLGFSEYNELFESNDIDVSVLKELSDNDLKEIGIASLGHRRKILAAVQSSGSTTPAATPVAAPVPVAAPSPARPESSRTERLFLETSFVTDKGKTRPVSITSHRAILGEKTYALANIAAVSTADNKDYVDAANKVKQMMKNLFVLFGLGSIVLGVLVSASTGEGLVLVPCVCAGLPLIIVGLSLKLETVLWSVGIQSAGTEAKVLTSTSRKDVQEVVDALNEAIINLNV